MKIVHSVCPCDCPDACGLNVQVEGNQVIRVQGNPKHTFTRGVLCPKMAHYERIVHHEGRIKTPLKRIGKKGEGKFMPITWEEAIQTIAEQFTSSIQTHGSESVLAYAYAGTMGLIQRDFGKLFFHRLGATRQDRGLCSPAKTAGWNSLMGISLSTRPQELGESDMVVLWSLDAVVTDLHIMRDVKEAKKKGATIWVIDTRTSDTMKFVDKRILVRPGSDGAFALSVMHVLHRDGYVDEAFVAEFVQGFEGFSKEELPKYTPEWASTITGVSASRIQEFAHAYGEAKAPFIRLGSGLSRYGNGSMTVRTVAVLPALVGAYQKVGGGILSDAGSSNFLNDCFIDYNMFQKEGDKEPRVMPMIKLGEALCTWEEPRIHCLYVHSTNPAATSPNQNLVKQGLLREDLFTVVHERFLTDTAAYADIVLPATTSLEHNDIYGSYGHYSLGVGYQAVPPVGESKSNWEVFQLLAKAMGYEDSVFDKTEIDWIHEFVEAAIGLTAEEKVRLLRGEPVEIPLPSDYKLRYETPSGKIELYNPREKYPYPTYLEPHGDDAKYWLINAPDIRLLNSSFNEFVKEDKAVKMVAYMHPVDAEKESLKDGDWVDLYNTRGTLRMPLIVDKGVLEGTIVAPGVWKQIHSSDNRGTINTLSADRFTDKGNGSTFYDVKVNVCKNNTP